MERLNNENTKRNLIAENSTKFLQTEITGLAQDFKNKVSKIGNNIVKVSNIRDEVKMRVD